jgi:hypothetical protein
MNTYIHTYIHTFITFLGSINQSDDNRMWNKSYKIQYTYTTTILNNFKDFT